MAVVHLYVEGMGTLGTNILRITGGQPVTLPEGATVGTLLDSLGIPKGGIWVVAINGVAAEHDHHLEDGDVVKLIPPIAGG
jgi:sulfur carrier protein ThiS